MFSLKVIRHADISKNELDEIIKIKSVAWPYPYEKQLEWISQHLKNSDLHLLLLENSKAVAYLNLVTIELEIDNKLIDALGIGNVCAIEKGKGYGNELMKLTNKLIKSSNKPGLLFCKPELVGFYEKIDWCILNRALVNLTFSNDNIETMINNFQKQIYSFKFKGTAF